MKVYFFSDNKNIHKWLKHLLNQKKHMISLFEVSKLRKQCKTVQGTHLVYLDIDGLEDEYVKDIKYLSKKENIFFGIIDLKGYIKDIAHLFFSGAVDYIRKIDTQNGFDEKRFSLVRNYLETYRCDFTQGMRNVINSENSKGRYKTLQDGWSMVEPGKEYAFSIMFVELDDEKELEKKYGRRNFKKALSTFITYIKKQISAFYGRVWFWSSAGGIILFPFDGTNCPAVLCGFRLKLFQHIYDVEESLFALGISFRIALHIGNVLYFEGDTGEIISDTINSVFHLGKTFAKPDSYYCTEDVFAFAPVPLRDYFIDAGKFEGRSIYRMKRHWFGK